MDISKICTKWAVEGSREIKKTKAGTVLVDTLYFVNYILTKIPKTLLGCVVDFAFLQCNNYSNSVACFICYHHRTPMTDHQTQIRFLFAAIATASQLVASVGLPLLGTALAQLVFFHV